MRLRRTGILTKIVLAVLLVYALVTKIGQTDLERQKRSELEDLRNYEARLAADVDGMQYAIDHSTDEEVLRDIARGQGFTDPDEEIYVNGGDAGQAE